MKTFLSDLRASLLVTAILLVVLCGAYPVAVWAVGRVCFRSRAEGSLIVDRTGAVRGSELLAQGFSQGRYFWPRPSAAGSGYDPLNSGGTNYGPTSAKLAASIRDAIAAYRKANGVPAGTPIPADAVTSSGSGLDPDISVDNALLQAPRVAKARGLPLERVIDRIAAQVRQPDWGLFGARRVNVLKLNLSLDGSP